MQADQLVGAWVCDSYSGYDPRGIDGQVQRNPVFGNDGTYADEVFGSASGKTSSGEDRTMWVRVLVKANWMLDKESIRLLFDAGEFVLAELRVDGQPVEPSTSQKQLAQMLTMPLASDVQLVEGDLEMRMEGKPVACRRRNAAG